MNPSSGAPAALEPVRARALALEAGFTEAGLVDLPYPETERDASRFSSWVGAGRAATMRYLQRVAEDGRLIRARVETPFPWARSAIVCFAGYALPLEPLSTTTPKQGDSLTGSAEKPVPSETNHEDSWFSSSASTAPVSSKTQPGVGAKDSNRRSRSKRPGSELLMSEDVDRTHPSSKELGCASAAWVARYAWSSRIDSSGKRVASDYHKVLLKRLKTLELRLHEEFGAFESRAYVDTGPVVERSLAVAAGLGWTGKNTCLIHPNLGSFGFLAVLLTSLEVYEPAGRQISESASRRVRESASRLVGGPAEQHVSELATSIPIPEATDIDVLKGHDFSRADIALLKDEGALAPVPIATLPHPDRCGSCTRCIQACPTNALDTPYQMDANRCIAYLTIEHKGPIDESLMPGIGRQVFGCDICQDVCPWNGKSRRNGPITIDPDLEPRPELINPSLDWLATLDEPAFERLFNGSPVRRTGFNGLRRNIAIAMGNSGLGRFIPQLKVWAEVADEGLRSAAQWALTHLNQKDTAE